MSDSPPQRYRTRLPISCFAFQQPTYTILDFHQTLTPWLTCLQPQRISTKPPCSLMPPRGRSRHPPAPTADDGNTQRDPAPIRQLCPGLSITDSQQNLRATAAPAFESSLCFTRNVQADASLRKRTPLGFSHPLVMAYPPHTTQTSLCAPENQLRSGIQGWGPAHPIPGTRAAHRLLLLGTRGLSSETG